MSKYEPLNAYLKSQTRDRIPMTFAEIERVLKNKLPPSKSHRAWWSNNPSNNVMTKEWLDAGFETEAVDVAGEKLVFHRVRKQSPVPPQSDHSGGGGFDEGASPKPLRHPAFGFMKGLLTIEEGFDVTRPLLDTWEEGYLGLEEKDKVPGAQR